MLWGISLLWWERIGKLMQVFGAATIIADIIGPDKIRRFGSSLQNTIPSTTLIQYLRQCFNWYAVVFRQTILKDYMNKADDVKLESSDFQLNLLNYLVCFFLTLFTIHSAQLYLAGWGALVIEAVIIFGFLLISIAPIFTVLTVMSLTMLGLAVNSFVIKPMAWVLEHPSLDRFMKITSLLLLLIGFHFELLAS